ncbi:marine proteobacterial sortase target protein [Kangiella koreensis]|uniref:Vault protein inter-alpha-trypsin domain protein n=1 Tax=Kangiella koreensis (strain DSM 16069 / JCM 12317 / KCTC 12182 / SW-125) TaxID=523791 RepID=C7R936_KANKD|nr:marine proteobacterial sortase target protein [Kangiella koreensis]ACV27826.1 Vault protein inter-alpha-trypsin domain protein [Kangiella koreensis DSM 16069]
MKRTLFYLLWGSFFLAINTASHAVEEAFPSSINYRSLESDLTFKQLPLSTDIEMHINSIVSRVSVKQTFSNQSDQWLEGVYQFPLPENAAVDTLKMHIGQRIIEGEVQEKQQAKRTYEKAKAEGKRTSLVEQIRDNLFTTKLANIAPGESITIHIEFQQLVHNDGTHFSMRMPLGITPRYKPVDATHEFSNNDNNDDYNYFSSDDSETVYLDTPAHHSAELSPAFTQFNTGSQPDRPVSVTVHLNPGFDLSLLESPYHKMNTQQTGGQYTIQLENPAQAERDFVLNWQPQLGQQPKVALFSESYDDHNYHVLMMLPPTHDLVQQKTQPREMIFVIDSSGSMSGESMQQAKQGLYYALSQLSINDTFNIIDFDNDANKLFDEAVPATLSNLEMAKYFVATLEADGGTEIAKAINLALDKPDSSLLRQVVFLTDGSIGNERQIFQMIENQLGNNRLFTIGIGAAPNSYFMSKAANYGRGTFTYIGKASEVQTKLEQLFKKLRYPALENLSLESKYSDQLELYPGRLRDLYLGEPLFVSYRIPKGVTNSVQVKGQADAYDWSFKLPPVTNGKDKGIARLWARMKIDAIKSDFNLSHEQSREQILKTALEYHLMSDYTSLVAVEKTPARVMEELKKLQLANRTPAGWKPPHGSLHGYPQGGTAANLAMLIGFVTLLLALAYQFTLSRRERSNA